MTTEYPALGTELRKPHTQGAIRGLLLQGPLSRPVLDACGSHRLKLQGLTGVICDHLGLRDSAVLVIPRTPKTPEGGFLRLVSEGV